MLSMKPLHHRLVCLLFSLSSVLLSINAAILSKPLIPTNLTTFNSNSLLDVSSNIGTINPSHFSTRIYFGHRALPAYPILMNAVNAMVQLALRNWEGQTGPQTFRLGAARYSQIEIFIGPADQSVGATMHPGYALLGLFDLMREMLIDPDRRCRSAQSEFFYEGRQVGRLFMRWTVGSPASPLALAQKAAAGSSTWENATPNQTQVPENRTSISTFSAAWSDPRLVISILLGPSPLPYRSIFYTVFVLLLKAAPHPYNNVVPSHIHYVLDYPPISIPGQQIAVSFRSATNPAGTSRNPPLFQWKWLVKATGLLVAAMLEEGNLREVKRVVLSVEGVEVGEGSIVRQPKMRDSE